MRLVLLALATVFCAGAAFAQDMPCRPPDGITQKATKTFVENYNAAQRALNAKDWAGAIGGAALARPHAIYGVQQAILLQIEIVAYDGWGALESLRTKLQVAIQSPCLSEADRNNYRRMLAEIISKPAAPQQR